MKKFLEFTFKTEENIPLSVRCTLEKVVHGNFIDYELDIYSVHFNGNIIPDFKVNGASFYMMKQKAIMVYEGI